MKRRVYMYRFVDKARDEDRLVTGIEVRQALEELYGVLATLHFWMLENKDPEERAALEAERKRIEAALPDKDRTVCVARFMGWADDKGRWVA